jgi:hypothetical protein
MRTPTPEIVSAGQWEAARAELLVKQTQTAQQTNANRTAIRRAADDRRGASEISLTPPGSTAPPSE